MDFSSLGPLAEALASRGITGASEIQETVIPPLLKDGGEDLLFTAPTGTGKTLAYLLPILDRLQKGNREELCRSGPFLLVLAPTHELCSQIKGEIDFLLKALGGSSAALLIGSVSLSRQIESLKKNKPPAVVGNPARVLQLVRMKKLSLRGLRFLVLDEGDRLMAEELFEETRELCDEVFKFPARSGKLSQEPAPGEAKFPPVRMISCSATFSEKNRERLFSLRKSGCWNTLEKNNAAVLQKAIEHWAFFGEERRKIPLLRSILAAAKPEKALVFTGRGGQLGNIVSQLRYHHLSAGGIGGDMDKKGRKEAMDAFRKGKLKILVATDLACRGLDVEGISHVIALDIPRSDETYLHRAGRTGRAGKRGIMASIGAEEELRNLARIEKKLGITVYPREVYGGRILAPDLSSWG